MSTHLLLVVSDIHGGSTVAVCPPDGIELDDGGRYMPSPHQAWLWKQWLSCWAEAAEIKKRVEPLTTHLVINGDCVDGDHHRTPQIVSPLESLHIRIAHRCLVRGPLGLQPDHVHMMRGTESHVGRSGSLEEGLARVLREEGHPMVEDPDTATVTSFWRRFMAGGLLVDCRHHGRTGGRAHTRGPYSRWYAQDIELEHRLDDERPPDLAIRSHKHTYEDSGRGHRWKTRVISTPAWQLMTAFAHKITIENLADIGIVAIVIKDGREEVVPILRKPDRPTIIEEAA